MAEKEYLKSQDQFVKRLNNPKQNEKHLKWYKSLMENGTLKDKISALSMIVRQEPKSTLKYVDELMKKAKSKDRKQAFMAIDALHELYTLHLLPEDKKLSSFKVLLGNTPDQNIKEQKLADMYYEHMLRASYIDFIRILESSSKDTLDHFKKLSINIITDCLIKRPEQEETLLSLLLNKLGDNVSEVSKYAAECTIRLLKKHSNMTPVVVGQVQVILERVNIQAMHNYMLLLNKILFFEDDIDHITNVIKLYFAQFKKLVNEESEEYKNRVISIIL